MTVLIDQPIWPHRGRRWAHMVSDTSLDELHTFAAALGVPPRGFHGDHYDIPEEYHQVAIDAGAVLTPSRELVRRLRAAGLRVGPAQRRSEDDPAVTSEQVHQLPPVADERPDR